GRLGQPERGGDGRHALPMVGVPDDARPLHRARRCGARLGEPLETRPLVRSEVSDTKRHRLLLFPEFPKFYRALGGCTTKWCIRHVPSGFQEGRAARIPLCTVVRMAPRNRAFLGGCTTKHLSRSMAWFSSGLHATR